MTACLSTRIAVGVILLSLASVAPSTEAACAWVMWMEIQTITSLGPGGSETEWKLLDT